MIGVISIICAVILIICVAIGYYCCKKGKRLNGLEGIKTMDAESDEDMEGGDYRTSIRQIGDDDESVNVDIESDDESIQAFKY